MARMSAFRQTTCSVSNIITSSVTVVLAQCGCHCRQLWQIHSSLAELDFLVNILCSHHYPVATHPHQHGLLHCTKGLFLVQMCRDFSLPNQLQINSKAELFMIVKDTGIESCWWKKQEIFREQLITEEPLYLTYTPFWNCLWSTHIVYSFVLFLLSFCYDIDIRTLSFRPWTKSLKSGWNGMGRNTGSTQ